MHVQRMGHKIALAAGVVALFVLLALAWSFSPLHDILDVPSMVQALHQVAQTFGPLVAIVAFAIALVCVVPLTFLSVVFIVAFGPFYGFVCAMVGAQLAALASYGLGVAVGRDILRKLGGARVNELSEKLGHKGLWAVIAVRLVPVAPFAVINMVAGASHIRLRDLLLGTLFGMAPGTLAMAFFIDKILDTMQNPSKSSVAAVICTLAFTGLGLWGIKVWLRRAERR